MRQLLTLLGVCALAGVLLSCGGSGGGYGSDPAPQQPTGDQAFDKVLPVLQANCLSCHGAGNAKGLPVFDTGAKFKASKAKAKLTAGAMPPPPKTISDADKATLLAYLGG